MDLAYAAAISLDEFKQRRQQVLDSMVDNSALIMFANTLCRRNDGCDYPFRQDSYFWYLTGFNEPNAVLVLTKYAQQTQSIIFLQPKDPQKEIWDGKRLGTIDSIQTLAIDQAFSFDAIELELPKLLINAATIYYERKQINWGEPIALACFAKLDHEFELASWYLILDEMRLIKSKAEQALMQQAGQISALAHIRAMRQARVNRYEYELEGEILHEFYRFGARYPAYNIIVASGDNACILHYIQNDKLINQDDLILIDAGCEFAYYAGDISRTFPVNGKFSQAQKDIYNLVLAAQKAAIELIFPGSSLQAANAKVLQIKVAGLVELGLLEGNVDRLIEEKAYQRFYMHSLGHWLGLDVHDVGSYNRPLVAGMVLTIEPGLYIPNAPDIPEQYRGIGVRIEDNLLVTADGNKVLTSAAPKEIADIEAIMVTN